MVAIVLKTKFWSLSFSALMAISIHLEAMLSSKQLAICSVKILWLHYPRMAQAGDLLTTVRPQPGLTHVRSKLHAQNKMPRLAAPGCPVAVLSQKCNESRAQVSNPRRPLAFQINLTFFTSQSTCFFICSAPVVFATVSSWYMHSIPTMKINSFENTSFH
jgi:hypothetical protein